MSISGIRSGWNNSATTLVKAASTVQKGVLRAAEEAGGIMARLYSVEGFTRISKATIANMEMLALFSRFQGVFNESLKTFRPLKELYYGTVAFDTAKDFVKEEISTAGSKRYKLGLPRDKQGAINWEGLLMSGAGIFLFAEFLKKCDVYSFPVMTALAARVGSVSIYSSSAIPVVGPALSIIVQLAIDRSKDCCVFLACTYALYKIARSKKIATWDNFFKASTSIGKMVLIASAGPLKQRGLGVVVTVVDCVTSNLGLIGFIYKKYQPRT